MRIFSFLSLDTIGHRTGVTATMVIIRHDFPMVMAHVFVSGGICRTHYIHRPEDRKKGKVSFTMDKKKYIKKNVNDDIFFFFFCYPPRRGAYAYLVHVL